MDDLSMDSEEEEIMRKMKERIGENIVTKDVINILE
jgi:hypothetical protein